MHEVRRTTEEIKKFLKQINLVESYEQQLLNYLEEARGQYEQIMCFYEKNSSVLNKL